ncbi:MAG: hypothetical protein ABIT20_11350 [Gemmatimonadaceae bacterium]
MEDAVKEIDAVLERIQAWVEIDLAIRRPGLTAGELADTIGWTAFCLGAVDYELR